MRYIVSTPDHTIAPAFNDGHGKSRKPVYVKTLTTM